MMIGGFKEKRNNMQQESAESPLFHLHPRLYTLTYGNKLTTKLRNQRPVHISCRASRSRPTSKLRLTKLILLTANSSMFSLWLVIMYRHGYKTNKDDLAEYFVLSFLNGSGVPRDDKEDQDHSFINMIKHGTLIEIYIIYIILSPDRYCPQRPIPLNGTNIERFLS